MKYEIKKKILIDMTLDSSEAIMFNQGGKHEICLSADTLDDLDWENCAIEISIQMERNSQGRFDFITSEAAKHRVRENENKSS